MWASTSEEYWESDDLSEEVEILPKVACKFSRNGIALEFTNSYLGLTYKNHSSEISASGTVVQKPKKGSPVELPAMGLDVEPQTTAELLRTSVQHFVNARTPVLVRIPMSLEDEQWSAIIGVLNEAAKVHPGIHLLIAVGEDFGTQTTDELNVQLLASRIGSIAAPIALLELNKVSENPARTLAALEVLAGYVTAGKARGLTVGAAEKRWQLKHYTKAASVAPIGVSLSPFSVFLPSIGVLSTIKESPLKFIQKKKLLPIVRGLLTLDLEVSLLDPRKEQRAVEIGERYGVSGPLVTLRWAMQMGTLPLAPVRSEEDAAFCAEMATSLLKTKLRSDEMALINHVTRDYVHKDEFTGGHRDSPQLFEENIILKPPPSVNGTISETHNDLYAYVRWFDPERPPRGTVGWVPQDQDHAEVGGMGTNLLKMFGLDANPGGAEDPVDSEPEQSAAEL